VGDLIGGGTGVLRVLDGQGLVCLAELVSEAGAAPVLKPIVGFRG
jgi:hypothetical protein